MRIITGKYKGRKLYMPLNYDVRPTTERVKEALFSSILIYIEDANVCDLFSGTGNLGLEALSRGASKCYFSDNAKESIELVKKNIDMCKANSLSIVSFGDYERCLELIKRNNDKIEIFFIDPPYDSNLYNSVVSKILELELLSPNGIIVLEHNSKDNFSDEYFGLKKIKDKKFGNITFTIYS